VHEPDDESERGDMAAARAERASGARASAERWKRRRPNALKPPLPAPAAPALALRRAGRPAEGPSSQPPRELGAGDDELSPPQALDEASEALLMLASCSALPRRPRNAGCGGSSMGMARRSEVVGEERERMLKGTHGESERGTCTGVL
jgi:hypothetical protein